MSDSSFRSKWNNTSLLIWLKSDIILVLRLERRTRLNIEMDNREVTDDVSPIRLHQVGGEC